MCVHLEDNCFGIDAAIQRIQKQLYKGLSRRFEGKTVVGYGKVYRVHEENRDFLPKRYNSDSLDYEDVYWSDYNDLEFCFIPDSDSYTEDEMCFNNETKVVFAMNLDSLYSDFKGRADGLAQKEIVAILRGVPSVNINGIQTGIDNIYSDFDFSKAQTYDMSKVHTFAVIVNLNFYLNDNC